MTLFGAIILLFCVYLQVIHRHIIELMSMNQTFL